jgi:hypothetical protein
VRRWAPTLAEIGWVLVAILAGLGFGLFVLYLIGKALGA